MTRIAPVAHAILPILALALCGCASTSTNSTSTHPSAGNPTGDPPVQLGNFSISLAVKDLDASQAFYEKLGFKVTGGAPGHYLIMQNDTATIGLYHGMFTGNILTFNPGWDRDCNTLSDYQDVREIQKILQERGLALDMTADPDTTGPGSITLEDPDGNQILIDQHAPSPNK